MVVFKNLDFLGNEPQIYIFGMSRYRTVLGALLSLLTITSILTLSLYFTVVVFTRQELVLISSHTNSFTKSINITSTPFLFTAAKANGDKYNFSIYYPIVQLWNYLPENKGTPVTINIPIKSCEKTDLAGFEDIFANFTAYPDYLCFDKSKLDLTVFGTNGDILNGYSKLQIYIAKCTNDSSLNPNVDKKNCMTSSSIDSILSSTPLHFYMTYPDNNIDFHNTSYPFYNYLRTEDFTFPLSANYKYSYILKKALLYSDFGLVFEDRTKEEIFQYDRTESTVFIGSGFNVKEAFGVISVSLSEKADSHIRSYSKLQSLVANIGGIVNFIYLIARFVVNYVSGKMLLTNYVNKRLHLSKLETTTKNDLGTISNIRFVGPPQNSIINQMSK
jgi:hypothetical protein